MTNLGSNNYIQLSNRIGIFLVFLFAICFAWYFIMPAEKGLHLQLFRMAYFGFSGFDVLSFVFGAIQTYVWGYAFVGVWRLSGSILGIKG